MAIKCQIFSDKKFIGRKFRMLFTQGKYVSLPKFPNFIETMETLQIKLLFIFLIGIKRS